MNALKSLLVFALLIIPAGCIDDTAGIDSGAGGYDALPSGIIVRNSDYFSSSISIINPADASLYLDNIIHSGSTSPNLSLALSGDVVFPTAPLPDNTIALIDRYPNSVLTFLSKEDYSVAWQISVATGFASNPHDLIHAGDGKAYVSRYERNPSPGKQSYDKGDDLLILDLKKRRITGRLDLDEFAGLSGIAGMQSRPERGLLAFGSVWVVLGMINGDFDRAGAGMVIRIDPETDSVIETFIEDGLSNCQTITALPGEEALLVSCSGLVDDGRASQIEHSGIWEIRNEDGGWASGVILHASALNAPISPNLAATENMVFFTTYGELGAATIRDRFYVMERNGDNPELLSEAGDAYSYGQIAADPGRGYVYICNADPVNPSVKVFQVRSGKVEFVRNIDSNPGVGLPPREIAFY